MKELIICVPAKNEAAHILETVQKLARSLTSLQDLEWKIVVVENGPRDGTLEKINGLSEPRIAAIRCETIGKGAALKLVAKNFESDYFGFIDADLSADPDVIPCMMEKISDNKVDVVIGSRLMQTRTTNRGALRTLSSRLFNMGANALLDLKVKDAQCGLKVMNAKSRQILASCSESGWFLDMEFLARLRKQNMTIVEVPVPWLEFRYPDRKSQVNTFFDSFKALTAMLRIRRNLRSLN